jgi:hypothetical protein
MGFKVPSSFAGPLAGKDPWPLRFYAHVFSAHHFNTVRCRIVYNTFLYTSLTGDMPAGPPPPHFLAHWTGSHVIVPESIGGKTFPGPVEVEWTALDGTMHEASVDLDAIFKDRLVLHNVSREDVGEAWLDSCRLEPEQPDILVEVNDRTINVYMRALVVTKHAQNTEDPNSNMRDDVMLAWSHTY